MVAILINSLTGGGAERVALTIAKELLKRGIPVEFICIDREQFYELPEGLSVTWFSDIHKQKNSLFKFLFTFVCAVKLKRLVRKKGIKVVQSHLIRSNYVNALSQLFGSSHKSQIVNHMMISFDKKRGFLGKANLYLYKRLYNKVDMIVSISKVMKEDLDNFFGLSGKVWHEVIYNPHEVDTIRQKSEEPVSAFQFNPEKQYIISVGRLVARKRVENLIQALAIVRKDHPQVELLVLGDGPEKEKYIATAQATGMTAYTHFLGHLPNPYALLARANIFVLASEDEGLPNIIIESMICGTPVISTDCKSGPRETLSPSSDIQFVLKEGVEKAEYGLLVPVGDISALAESIRMMLSDEILQGDYRQRGLQRANDFGVEKVVQTYINSFNN